MKKSEAWLYSSPVNGQTVFRTILGKSTNLNLSLAIISNDKRIKDAGADLRTVLEGKESKEIKKLKSDLEKTTDEAEKTTITAELNKLWEKFTNSKEVKEWFAEEYDITLARCTLDKKTASTFDTDQIEVLMFFTNIAELGEEVETEKPKKAKK